MARLEIDLSAKDSGAAKVIGETTSQLQRLQEQYDSASRSIKSNGQESLRLEGALNSLRQQFAAGTISEAQFAKQSDQLGLSLSSVRNKSQEYQAQLRSLTATMKQVESGTGSVGTGVNKLAGYHQDFTKGIRGSTTVALEFGRVIQDAPYGIQGVANNIQQLTTNLGYYVTNARAAAAASGQTLTSMQLASGVFKSLLTPMSLITIAVSAITVGWQLYSKSAAKTAKENEKLANSTKEYAETLEAVRGAQLKGAQSAQAEISQLDVLYSVTQDATQSTANRKRAVDELQKTYPAYFKNIKDEAILNGNATSTYNRLRDSILATAQAKAAYDKISQNASKSLENEFRLIDLSAPLQQLDQQIAKQEKLFDIQNKSASISGQSQAEATNSRLNKLYDDRKVLVAEIDTILGEQNKFLIYNVGLADRAKSLYGDQVKELEKVTGATKAQTAALTDYAGKLDEILNKSSNQADASLLTGLDLDVEKTRQKYEDLYNSINSLENKALNDKKLNESQRNAIVQKASDARVRITANEIKEQESNVIKNAEKVQDIAFQYTRRLNESRTQSLMRQLNAETKLKLASLSGDTDAQLRLQEDYYKRVEELAAMDRQNKVELAFDGTAFSSQLEQINQDLALVRQQFESGLGVDEFQAKVLELESARQQIQVMRQGIDSVSDAFGNLTNDILFDTQNAFSNLGETFASIIKSMIGGLAKLGVRYLINQAIGTTSMAATTAASTAAAGATAAAWSTAAALVSAATFGANVATGGAALTALIASTKALSLTGFSQGGYTGNMGVNQISGVVHGKEYVINAAATAKHKSLLDSINSGTFTGVSSATANSLSSGSLGSQAFIADTRIEGSDLVIAYRRASRDIDRYSN